MIGGLLKDKRLSKGITLEQIAADLKIRVYFLKALEEENFELLPADVYTMGYIRTYAMYLGIEPEPLIEEFKALREKKASTVTSATNQEIVPETAETDKADARSIVKNQKSGLKSQSPRISSKLSFKPNFLILGVIILIGGIAIFSIFKTTRQQKELTLPASAVPVQSSQTSSPSDNLLNQTSPYSQLVQSQAPAVTPQPLPSPSIPAPVAKKEPATVTSATSSEGYALKIVAAELSWLLVESEEGSHDITLKPGDTVQYTSKKGFKIKTGNAGGIKLFLNGKDMGSPGKSGEVKIINLP
ncbi:MAG: RodZ domain-containing protein [Thermodesulfovibrionales bacterium]